MWEDCHTNLEMSASYQNRNVRFSFYPIRACFLILSEPPSICCESKEGFLFPSSMDGPPGLCVGLVSWGYALSSAFEGAAEVVYI
jgi:hypothetical protein